MNFQTLWRISVLFNSGSVHLHSHLTFSTCSALALLAVKKFPHSSAKNILKRRSYVYQKHFFHISKLCSMWDLSKQRLEWIIDQITSCGFRIPQNSMNFSRIFRICFGFKAELADWSKIWLNWDFRKQIQISRWPNQPIKIHVNKVWILKSAESFRIQDNYTFQRNS